MDVSGGEMTIMAWVSPRGFNSWGDNRIISKATDTSSHWWMLSGTNCAGGSCLRARIRANGVMNTVVSDGLLNLDEWHHVAVTFDGSLGSDNIKMYRDGVLLGVTSGSDDLQGILDVDPSVGANIGRNPDGYGAWDGKIDDLRVYEKALSQSEIQEIMNPQICNTPADSNCDNCISITELASYIIDFQNNIVNPTDLSKAILAWQQGC